jgi:hypothetical protein
MYSCTVYKKLKTRVIVKTVWFAKSQMQDTKRVRCCVARRDQVEAFDKLSFAISSFTDVDLTSLSNEYINYTSHSGKPSVLFARRGGWLRLRLGFFEFATCRSGLVTEHCAQTMNCEHLFLQHWQQLLHLFFTLILFISSEYLSTKYNVSDTKCTVAAAAA